MRMLLLIVFVVSCKVAPDQDTIVVIQPLGRYDAALTDTLRRAIRLYYGVQVLIGVCQSIPESFFVQLKTPRYRADSIIHYLRTTKPGHVDYVLGFTNQDISTTKKDKSGRIKQPVNRYTDWGVMGLAYSPGVACVVSTYRLKSNEQKLTDRTIKVALHELGHSFGLPHCENKKCVMTDAVESVRTVDQADPALCSRCKHKIGLRE